MRKVLAGLFVACPLSLLLVSGAQAGQRIELSSPAIQRITDDFMRCRFDEAQKLCDSLRQVDSSNALPVVLSLMGAGLKSLDLEMRVESAQFERWYADALRLLEKSSLSEDAVVLLLGGFARAAYTSYSLREGRYLAAAGTGMDALGMLQKASSTDAALADADFFLGLYECAWGELRRRLPLVLFWHSGNLEEGLRKLRRCANAGTIARWSSKLTLAQVLVENKRFKHARPVLDELSSRFPQSRFVYWAWAEYHEKQDEFTAATRYYALLQASYWQSPGGEYNALATGLLQATMLYKNRDVHTCVAVCDVLLKRGASFRQRKPHAGILEDIGLLRTKAQRSTKG
jgi:tetratricopeptide (TPR) repeat protein